MTNNPQKIIRKQSLRFLKVIKLPKTTLDILSLSAIAIREPLLQYKALILTKKLLIQGRLCYDITEIRGYKDKY